MPMASGVRPIGIARYDDQIGRTPETIGIGTPPRFFVAMECHITVTKSCTNLFLVSFYM